MGSAAAAAPCIFCEIGAGKSPAHVVYEDAGTIAFLDIFPFTRGHLLVVPKRHVDRLVDLAPSEYAGYLGALAQACRQVERLTKDYNIGLNQGRLAGQIVFHLHFHVIPRYDDGNPFGPSPRRPLTEGEGASVVHDLGGPLRR
jgi:histidine triad (HIT) family protein